MKALFPGFEARELATAPRDGARDGQIACHFIAEDRPEEAAEAVAFLA